MSLPMTRSSMVPLIPAAAGRLQGQLELLAGEVGDAVTAEREILPGDRPVEVEPDLGVLGREGLVDRAGEQRLHGPAGRAARDDASLLPPLLPQPAMRAVADCRDRESR